MNMYRAFLGNNIFFHKVNNTIFHNFSKKYTGKEIPNQSVLRDDYFTGCYEETIKNIQNNVNCKKYLFLQTKQQVAKAAMLQM